MEWNSVHSFESVGRISSSCINDLRKKVQYYSDVLVNSLSEDKMSKKAYLIVGSCLVLGLLLTLTDSPVGLVVGLFLIAWGVIFFLISYSSDFREIAFGIMGIRRSRINPPLGSTQSVQHAMTAYPDLVRVIYILENSRLPQKFGDDPEKEAETWVSEQLKDEFPDYTKREHHIEIGSVGIEIKLPRTPEDLTTLREQIPIMLKQSRRVVVLIVNYYRINSELIEDLKEDMKKKHGDKVTVIEKVPKE